MFNPIRYKDGSEEAAVSFTKCEAKPVSGEKPVKAIPEIENYDF